MKQTKWKENVEAIKLEMLKRGKERSAPEILKQFSTRLSATILHFFAESESFSPHKNLTVDQNAFTHSLQLYDLHSVMRLVVNYDVSKGLKVVIPGIEKSYRSLMVIPRLEGYIKNSLESTALSVYKFRLEESLVSFLCCNRQDLYEEKIFNEKMEKVSKIEKTQREKFFNERLKTLFSSNYRTYLMLKNRYFLNLIFRYGNNKNLIMQAEKKIKLPFSQGEIGDIAIKKMEEKFDFRFVEQYVKKHIFKNIEKESLSTESNFLSSLNDFVPKSKSNSQNGSKQKSIQKKQISFNNSIYGLNRSNTVKQKKLKANLSPFLKLCAKYENPIKEMIESFSSVPECSSPYFLPRAEDYRIEYSSFFREILGMNLEVIEEMQDFTLELLLQRGREYNAAERWGMVSLRRFDKKSEFFRKPEKGENFLDRKNEWSILIQFCVPFDIHLPMGNKGNILIEKGKICLFQIGTAFFDHGIKKKIEEFPDVFFKLMFGGHILTSKNAVIHVENDPFFTTTLSQMWHCRGLIYLFFIAISRRFSIELTSNLKYFLVEFLPKTLHVTGFIPSGSNSPNKLKSYDEEKV